VSKPLDFGVFITPFHPVGQSPTVALEYDLERTVALDRLGYDEMWFGEHHSGGYELIACPEVHRRGGRADQAHSPRHRCGRSVDPSALPV
jgi:alkanesulfonate monooxygenase SsuD/methylene tetrahydromethanopterin reductase-like flavin-dependent oxidoreductase (luciferase family)